MGGGAVLCSLGIFFWPTRNFDVIFFEIEGILNASVEFFFCG